MAAPFLTRAKEEMIETHRIYPIGKLDDGYTYYVEIPEWGGFTWAKEYPEFDYEEGPPTLRDEEMRKFQS